MYRARARDLVLILTIAGSSSFLHAQAGESRQAPMIAPPSIGTGAAMLGSAPVPEVTVDPYSDLEHMKSSAGGDSLNALLDEAKSNEAVAASVAKSKRAGRREKKPKRPSRLGSFFGRIKNFFSGGDEEGEKVAKKQKLAPQRPLDVPPPAAAPPAPSLIADQPVHHGLPVALPTPPVETAAAPALAPMAAPAEVPMPVEAPPPAPEKYTVKKGDTLERIARRKFGSARHAQNLAAANGLTLESTLQIGQKLQMPPRPRPRNSPRMDVLAMSQGDRAPVAPAPASMSPAPIPDGATFAAPPAMTMRPAMPAGRGPAPSGNNWSPGVPQAMPPQAMVLPAIPPASSTGAAQQAPAAPAPGSLAATAWQAPAPTIRRALSPPSVAGRHTPSPAGVGLPPFPKVWPKRSTPSTPAPVSPEPKPESVIVNPGLALPTNAGSRPWPPAMPPQPSEPSIELPAPPAVTTPVEKPAPKKEAPKAEKSAKKAEKAKERAPKREEPAKVESAKKRSIAAAKESDKKDSGKKGAEDTKTPVASNAKDAKVDSKDAKVDAKAASKKDEPVKPDAGSPSKDPASTSGHVSPVKPAEPAKDTKDAPAKAPGAAAASPAGAAPATAAAPAAASTTPGKKSAPLLDYNNYEFKMYVVKAGDTVSTVKDTFYKGRTGVDGAELLKRFNQLADEDPQLHAGQKLLIPLPR